MLEKLDLTKKLPKKVYQERVPHLQRRLLELQQAAWRAKIPSVLVVEGWDGSGKGDCVRKLTERLEPRGYRLHFVSQEPRTYESYLPWMWRFWLEIPNYGQMTIFHRSWYRRVLLDRGEGRSGELAWHRAVRDILDFERMLSDDGYVFSKVFLHLSKAERARRYKQWKKDPATSWRVTKEDWRHHRRYDDYRPFVEMILERTDSAWSPWKIVEATDLRWARVSVLETVTRGLEEALRARRVPIPRPPEDAAATASGVGDLEVPDAEG